MTLPQNVKNAVGRVDRSLSEWGICQQPWQTIRAHLMSQEAEIDRLRGQIQFWHDSSDEVNNLWQTDKDRLAAANALLRECVAGLGHVGYPESMAMFNGDHRRAENLHDEILEHLQGAGDEAV